MMPKVSGFGALVWFWHAFSNTAIASRPRSKNSASLTRAAPLSSRTSFCLPLPESPSNSAMKSRTVRALSPLS